MYPAKWRFHLGWLLAVPISVILYGGVNQEAQALCAILIGSTLLLPRDRGSAPSHPLIPRWLLVGTILLIVIPLIPLPAGLVKFLSPERAELAFRIPTDEAASSWIP